MLPSWHREFDMTRQRTALITGSGRNIGRAIAVALARDGFDIVLNGSANRAACESVAEAVRGLGRKANVVMGDVGSKVECARIAAEAGSVDVLVNNAAVRPVGGFLEMSESDFQRVMDVDLYGAIWLSRAVLPGMIARNWGRIVNFSGMNSIAGYADRPAVSVAKHGAWGLTKVLAKEFASKGITANIISPGPIEPDEGSDPNMAAHIRGQAAKIPAGRLGKPQEIAAMVSLLVSENGAFINGQMLQVNGATQT
jgi:3-oxoacyl-[acyl-carrier protein] reductase